MASENDRTGNYGNCRATFSGRMFDVIEPKASDVCIEDIAYPLSVVPRFAGQCGRCWPKVLSIAEHCCTVHDLVAAQYPGNKSLALLALLHDAAEAYVGDMVRPLKVHDDFYRMSEDRIQDAIDEHFGVVRGAEEREIIKRADNIALRAEAYEVMTDRAENWEWGSVPHDTSIAVHCYPPGEAAVEFLSRLGRNLP